MSSGIRSLIIVGVDETLRLKFRSVLSPALSASSFALYHDSQGAISAARDHAPSLLALEWNAFTLSEMTSLLQRFRALPRCSNVPILIIANRTTGDIASIAVEYDVTKVLTSGTSAPEFKRILKDINDDLLRPSGFRFKISQLENATEENDQKRIETTILNLYHEFPDSHRAKIEYANLCLKNRDYEQAINIARKALAFSPDNLRALNIIARAHLQTGRFEDAVKILERSDGLSPGNAERLVALGDGLLALNKVKQAKEKYQAATKIDTRNLGARRGLLAIELSESNLNHAVELLRDSKDSSEIASLYNNIGIFSARRGEIETAELSYQTALRALSQDFLKAKVHFNLGLAFERQNIKQRAIDAYREALALNPDFQKCHTRFTSLNTDVAPPFSGVHAILREDCADEESLDDRVFANFTPRKFERLDTSEDALPIRFALDKQKE